MSLAVTSGGSGSTPVTINTPILSLAGKTDTSSSSSTGTINLMLAPFTTNPFGSVVTLDSTSWYLYSDAALTQLVASSVDDLNNLYSYTFVNLAAGSYFAYAVFNASNAQSSSASNTVNITINTLASTNPPPVNPPATVFDGRISTLPLAQNITGNELAPILKNNQNLSIRLSNLTSSSSTGAVDSVHLAGSNSVFSGNSISFTITNYDVLKTYTATVSSGSVSITDRIINFTAPSQPGAVILTVNNKPYTITILPGQVATPSIIYPTNNSTLSSSSITITSSAFSSTTATENQVSATWQMATDSAFTQIFSSLTNSTTQLNSWTVNNLSVNTTYYVRVQYTGSINGTSSWSNGVSFTTNSAFYPYTIIQDISAPNASSNSFNFGNSVAADAIGQNLAIGNYNYYPASSGGGYGNVYIFNYDSTTNTYLYSTILESDPSVSSTTYYFGAQVAMSSDGSTVVASDPGQGSSVNNGLVCIYKKTNGSWILIQTLKTPNTLTNGYFGHSLAMSDDSQYLFVGDTNYTSSNYSGINLGSICVYTYDASTGLYTLSTQLQPDYTQTLPLTANSYTNFAGSLSCSSNGQTLVCAATGNVFYIYTLTSGQWSVQAITLPSSNYTAINYFTDGLNFFTAITSDGLTVAVTFINTTTNNSEVFIYRYTNSAWTLLSQIVNPNTSVNTNFGYSMQFLESSSYIYISSSTQNITGSSSVSVGVVYIFDYSIANGNLVQTIEPTVSYSNMNFGTSLFITSNNRLFIGADADPLSSTNIGSTLGSVYYLN